MISVAAINDTNKKRRSRGAIYSVCFIGCVTPCVLAMSNIFLQAGLSFYSQHRLDYIAGDAIEHFQSISEFEPGRLRALLQGLAAANGVSIKSSQVKIAADTNNGEPTLDVEWRGQFQNSLGIFTENKSFIKKYKIKLSQFESFGYLAVNSYPYCQVEPTRGLSAYLPIYRPSSDAPVWGFVQDNAIGNVRRTVSEANGYDESKSTNWKNVADGIISIY